MTAFSPGQDPGAPDPAHGPAPVGLIWTRPPKQQRQRPAREAIVAAATGLAGTHGLDAVSIRRGAAALNTRPMDLYRYFTRKDELIDLMVDEGCSQGKHRRPAMSGSWNEVPRTAGAPQGWKGGDVGPVRRGR